MKMNLKLLEMCCQVGWGSKETQFHGSAGKGASKQPVFATPTPIATTDSQETRVSWRGDGQYFVVSTVDQRDDNFYRLITDLRKYCTVG